MKLIFWYLENLHIYGLYYGKTTCRQNSSLWSPVHVHLFKHQSIQSSTEFGQGMEGNPRWKPDREAVRRRPA